LQAGLNACDYPFSRIRRNTGARIPVTVSDLSRWESALDEAGSHGHVHNAEEHGHLLGAADRRAVLGLYWLPTRAYPAGRVELDAGIMDDPDLAREVLLAEGAHAVDYGQPLTDAQRKAIAEAYHEGSDHAHGPRDPHGWFEERGEDDYWDWVGESFMSGFMEAFAPSLPRPLEGYQPWKHPTTPEIGRRIREVILGPKEEREPEVTEPTRMFHIRRLRRVEGYPEASVLVATVEGVDERDALCDWLGAVGRVEADVYRVIEADSVKLFRITKEQDINVVGIGEV